MPSIRPATASSWLRRTLVIALMAALVTLAYSQRFIQDDAFIIEIPLNQGYKLTALYLSPSPCIDSAIAERGWSRFPIRRER